MRQLAAGRGDDGIRETLFLPTGFFLCDFGGMAALGGVCTDLKREVLDTFVEGEMEGERA